MNFVRVLIVFYSIIKINWINFFRLKQSNSANAILVWPSYPNDAKEYLFGNNFLNDIAIIAAFVSSNKNFKLCIGFKSAKRFKNKSIFLNGSRLYPSKQNNSENYQEAFLHCVKDLNLLNKTIPSLEDCALWENKEWMHKFLNEKEIYSPKTITASDYTEIESIDLKFPIIYKPTHSAGGNGILKFESEDDCTQYLSVNKSKNFLLQEWVDIKKDLRLVFIDNKLVLHYMRINTEADWKANSCLLYTSPSPRDS